jgi:hypothetical protein
MGKPVLYGHLVGGSTYDTINEEIDGLQIPSPINDYISTDSASFGRAKCTTSSQMVGTSPVKFGYDVSTGCVMHLTR